MKLVYGLFEYEKKEKKEKDIEGVLIMICAKLKRTTQIFNSTALDLKYFEFTEKAEGKEQSNGSHENTDYYTRSSQ